MGDAGAPTCRRWSRWPGGIVSAGNAWNRSLENVARQILVLSELGEPLVHVRSIDRHLARAAAPGLEGNLLQQLFEHGVEPPGADVLGLLVHLVGDLREAADRLGLELDVQSFGREERLVLLHLAR